MTKYTAITFFLLLFARVSWADHTVHVAIDHAPPFSQIDQQGESQGLIIDILSELLKESHQDYKIKPVPCPFSRCVRMLSQKAHAGTFWSMLRLLGRFSGKLH